MFIIKIRSNTKFLGSYILWSVVSMKSISVKFNAIQWSLMQFIQFTVENIFVYSVGYNQRMTKLNFHKNMTVHSGVRHMQCTFCQQHSTVFFNFYGNPKTYNNLLCLQIPIQLILYSLLYSTHFEGELYVLTGMVFGVVTSTGMQYRHKCTV